MDAVRARGGRAGRRCSRGRSVRQDALRDPVSPSLFLSPPLAWATASSQLASVLHPTRRALESAQSWLLSSCAVCRGGTIQRAVRRMAGGASRRRPHALADSGTADSSASASASCSGVGSRFPDDQSLPLTFSSAFACDESSLFPCASSSLYVLVELSLSCLGCIVRWKARFSHWFPNCSR